MPSMSSPATATSADWLRACRRAVEGLREVFAEHPTSRERIVETGDTGEGGDQTLVIDQEAEDAVFAQLDALHAEGARFTAISEERGVIEYGGGDVRVVIDPLDGSLNAKRGLGVHALSLAVADGPTMADVHFGFVVDFGPAEEWVAVRGKGAWLNDVPVDAAFGERRVRDRLAVVGVENADPRWVAARAGALEEVAHRLRAIGAIASSLCQVAGGRLDGMMSLRRCRAVDAAAAQLVVREAGGLVAFTAYDDPLAAPLDLAPHSPVVAARTPEGLRELSRVPMP
jgi:myo-inositol-1(or 4)-monophosphatase